jgi:pyroglutamyl-peptidase
MLPRILLTGFKPFGDLAINPTEPLMTELSAAAAEFPGVQLDTLVLDVDYALAEAQFRAALQQCTPDAILSFGVDGRADALHLERIAVNLDDAGLPDTGGETRGGTRIVADGPVGYWATLDLDRLYRALVEAEIPVRYSNHAGTYLCNHVFYYGLHTIATLGLETRMGFVHVPPLPPLPSAAAAMEALVRAARVCVGEIPGALCTNAT